MEPSTASLLGPAAGQGTRISTMFVRALVEAVDAAGGSSEEFVRVANVDAGVLASPYGWVEIAELDRLTVAAVAFTGDPAFGLHWAERSPMTKFDVMAMATAHAPTLRAALAFVQRFQPLLSEAPQLELIERAHTVLLRFAPLAVSEVGTRVQADLAVACLARLLRFMRAPSSATRRVLFRHRAPEYGDEYTRIFAGRARFEQACTGIEFDASCLDQQLDQANAELHQLLKVQAQNVLARNGSSAGHAGKVRALLRRMFPRLPEMPEVARALNISERSLRRRLDEEGWSYSSILQESRLLLAQQLLADETRSIKEVGFEVGFESTPAFHRAFKRWTGESPAAYRATVLSTDPSAPTAESDASA